jgi:hypothetical protein
MSVHRHHPDELHPAYPAPLSLLRLSAGTRLAVALMVAALMWIAVWWAIS